MTERSFAWLSKSCRPCKNCERRLPNIGLQLVHLAGWPCCLKDFEQAFKQPAALPIPARRQSAANDRQKPSCQYRLKNKSEFTGSRMPLCAHSARTPCYRFKSKKSGLRLCYFGSPFLRPGPSCKRSSQFAVRSEPQISLEQRDSAAHAAFAAGAAHPGGRWRSRCSCRRGGC